MSNTKDRMAAWIRKRIAAWRRVGKDTESMRAQASENPRLHALWLLAHLRRNRRNLRRMMRGRFGVETRYHGQLGEQRIAIKERFPYPSHDPEENEKYARCRAYTDLLYQLDLMWAAAYSAFLEAEDSGENPYEAALEAYYEVRRLPPWTATTTRKTEPSEVLRAVNAANLAGWVGSRISLTKKTRHRDVLKEDADPGKRASERLVDELVPTTIVAWDELDFDEAMGLRGRTNLVSRVEKLLEELGHESTKLAREGKLSGERPESTASDREDGFEEFERRETSRQDLDALRRSLVKKGGFSERETRVFDLDMETDHDTSAIAHELRLEPETVRTYRKRYRDKLRRAAGL